MTVFEKGAPGQRAYSLPKEEEAWAHFSPEGCRDTIDLPELTELDLTRHFIGLTHKSMGVDNGLIPLGSCTMKFNPRLHEAVAHMAPFQKAHPLAPEETVQGTLQILYEFLQELLTLTGMEAGTLLPNAGAQGELVGVKMIAAYHSTRGDRERTEFLIPDSAHGTNPATAAMAGFSVRTVPTSEEGLLDRKALEALLSHRTAGFMVTNPSTLGLFEPSIGQITQKIHQIGGLVYYDGANLNPLMGIVRPVDMGCDVMHINVHKTFSTPHGAGGPGAGPVLCTKRLAPFLPVPLLEKKEERYGLQYHVPLSIGRVASFFGNVAVCLRALIYIRMLGRFGLRKSAEQAVLNANYLKKKLESSWSLVFRQPCMHEFVIQADQFLEKGIRAVDIAKRLLDYGVYAPTIYFPLIVKEAMLIEPTETESKATLDKFVEILINIAHECVECPEKVLQAPHNCPVRRLDEVRAAKEPHICHSCL